MYRRCTKLKRQPVFQKRPPLHYVSETLSKLAELFSLLLFLSFFPGKREGHASADTLINGLRHAIPRDPFEKLRTIDLARFRNEGCTLSASLSPCTERGNDANAASACPLAERKRGGNERGETTEWVR